MVLEKGLCPFETFLLFLVLQDQGLPGGIIRPTPPTPRNDGQMAEVGSNAASPVQQGWGTEDGPMLSSSGDESVGIAEVILNF